MPLMPHLGRETDFEADYEETLRPNAHANHPLIGSTMAFET